MAALELQLYVDDFSKDIFQKFGLGSVRKAAGGLTGDAGIVI